MNTMELVRLVERAQPRPASTRTPPPPFRSELIGPVRQAILCARQFLLSEQRDDGSWLGRQTGDVSLPSQLILSLAYLDREGSQLAEQAVATILAQQLPNGGWSRGADGQPDVSISVQAYFALKLAGLEPCDERLGRARRTIRQLGGADAADVATRYFLALLGQINYNKCASMPPESLLIGSRHRRWHAPLAIIWSHRPSRQVNVDRGVRELFINPPCDWPGQSIEPPRSPGSRIVRTFLGRCLDSLWGRCERRGWTPFRHRALDFAEFRVLEHIDATNIRQLDFYELLWHTIALRAIGYPRESRELQTCEARLQEMVEIDDETNRAVPRLRTSPTADTVVVLQTLNASGISLDRPAFAAAMKFLAKTRRSESELDVPDIASVVQLIATANDRGHELDNPLPPEIEVARDDWIASNDVGRADRRVKRFGRIAAALIEALIQQQNADGGWSTRRHTARKERSSTPDVTGAILEAIAATKCGNAKLVVENAVEYLRTTQRADGSWKCEAGLGQIHATSIVIRGLVAVGLPHNDDAVASGVNWLVVQQQPSGGWGESPIERSTVYRVQGSEKEAPDAGFPIWHADACPPSTSPTSWALSALVAAGLANHASARRAVDYLIETQGDDGQWRDPQYPLRDDATGRLFRNELHTSAWPLLALSRWAVDESAHQAGEADSIALRLVNAYADT